MPSRTRRTPPSQDTDAIGLLKADHAEVKKLFTEFEKARKQDDEETRREIVESVCQALTVHATIEEEIFYPAFRDTKGMEDLLDEAEVEHTSLKTLVGELEEASPGDELYDAKVKVLAEYVEHHVKEEEGEIFPKAKKSDVDLDALGEALAERKEQLSAGETPPPQEDERGRATATRR